MLKDLVTLTGYTPAVLAAVLMPGLIIRFTRVRNKLRLVELRVNWPWWSRRSQ